MLALLTGGPGGAKLVHGLSLETNPQDLVIVGNTGDDIALHGLHISPDLDTIIYTLAGIVDDQKGWGIKGDSFVILEWLSRYGQETWFRLGDRDLALHIVRSNLLRRGLRLSEITDQLRKSFGIQALILPMSDDRVETRVVTQKGAIGFQEYFVRDRWADEPYKVLFAGVERSQPAPGIIEAIGSAQAVVFCPSNPVTSIGPILAVPGIRAALQKSRAPIIAVSPIVRATSFSGPAHKLMAGMGMEVSAFGVAQSYADFLSIILIAPEDAGLKAKIEELGIKAVVTPILMDSLAEKQRLARNILGLL